MPRRTCKRALSVALAGVLSPLAFGALSLTPSDAGIVPGALAKATTRSYTTRLGVTKADCKALRRYQSVASYKGQLAKGEFSFVGNAYMSSGRSSETITARTKK